MVAPGGSDLTTGGMGSACRIALAPVEVAYEAAAPLARAVADAGSLEEANEILRSRGVRSELDWEQDAAAGRA